MEEPIDLIKIIYPPSPTFPYCPYVFVQIKCYRDPANAQRTTGFNLILVTVNKQIVTVVIYGNCFQYVHMNAKSWTQSCTMIPAIVRAHWNATYILRAWQENTWPMGWPLVTVVKITKNNSNEKNLTRDKIKCENDRPIMIDSNFIHKYIHISTYYPLYRGATLDVHLARRAFTRRATSPGAIPRWHYL